MSYLFKALNCNNLYKCALFQKQKYEPHNFQVKNNLPFFIYLKQMFVFWDVLNTKKLTIFRLKICWVLTDSKTALNLSKLSFFFWIIIMLKHFSGQLWKNGTFISLPAMNLNHYFSFFYKYSKQIPFKLLNNENESLAINHAETAVGTFIHGLTSFLSISIKHKYIVQHFNIL